MNKEDRGLYIIPVPVVILSSHRGVFNTDQLVCYALLKVHCFLFYTWWVIFLFPSDNEI